MLSNLCPMWTDIIGEEICKPYMLKLLSFVEQEDKKYNIFPPENLRLRAYELVDFYDISIVLIGMDPYFSKGQANGLCFSVEKGQKIPPSLKNIYKEINRDLGVKIPSHGDLTRWAAEYNVLMINTSLTVREGEAGSHSKKGWEVFTSSVLKTISDNLEGVVFLAWGNHAKSCVKNIDRSKHLVLETSHPSPLGARHGFNGCGHFSEANKYLELLGKKSVDWGDVG